MKLCFSLSLADCPLQSALYRLLEAGFNYPVNELPLEETFVCNWDPARLLGSIEQRLAQLYTALTHARKAVLVEYLTSFARQ